MNIESISFGQTVGYRLHAPNEVNVINEHEIKSILYLGIRGLQAKNIEEIQKSEPEHTVDTFV
jgi:hypothetical protein